MLEKNSKSNRHMRLILLFITSLYVNNCLAQHTPKTKQRIDALVNAVDNNKNAKRSSFTKLDNKKLLQYTYIADTANVLMIRCNFGEHNDSIEQVFYFYKNKLIYSTESIISYYKTGAITDSTGWGGTYYFSNNKLIDIVTLGHGKSETDTWDPEKEVLINCNQARIDVIKYRIKEERRLHALTSLR
jgi:hypothetical protein